MNLFLQIRKKIAKSVILTWVVSYALVLMIPAAVGIINYVYANHALKKEIISNNSALTRSLQKEADSLLEQMYGIAYQISKNQTLTELMQMNQETAEQQYMRMYDIHQELATYKIVNRIFKTGIYFPDTDYYVTGDTVNYGRYLFDAVFPESDITYEFWNTLHRKEYNNAYLTNDAFRQSPTAQGIIAYVNTFKIEGRAANIIVTAEFGDFIRKFQLQGLDNGETIAVLDAEGRMVLSSGTHNEVEALTQSPAFLKQIDEGNYFEAGKQLVFSVKSSVSGWRYVVFTPADQVWSKSNYLRNITLVSWLTCMVMAVLAVWYISRKNYSPINAIVNSIKSKVDVAGETTNELDLIGSTVYRIFDENRDIRATLSENHEQLSDVFLLRYLKGSNLNLSPDDVQSVFEFEPGFENYALIVMYLDNEEQTIEANEYRDKQEFLALMKYSVDNVMKELMGGQYEYKLLDDDLFLIWILNIHQSRVEIWKQEMKEKCNTVVTFFRDKFELGMMIAVSPMASRFEDLSTLYDSSMDTLQYQMVIGAGGVVESSDGGPRDFRYELETDRYKLLAARVKAGDYPAVETMIGGLFDEIASGGRVNVKLIQFTMLDIVRSVFRSLAEISDFAAGDYFEAHNPLGALMECDTLAALRERLLAELAQMCEYMNQKQKASSLTEQIKRYVGETYQDMNLNITLVADHFGLHPYYVSRQFKEDTGEGLLDFINHLRIERAKELLLEKRTVEEVSRLVGFSNSKTFRRVFMKFEKTTPGRYAGEM